ncbi:MAG: GAP family protein [Microthrixaceae bacterium]|nr:GAP family protein [Microthrixaceae bacterium]
MGQGISAVVGFAVGVAVSPFPIIAVILMLFTPRARVNGPMFGLGWMVSLAVVSGAASALADIGDASTSSGVSDGIAWGKVLFGLLLLAGAARTWKRRPAPGEPTEMPKWMSSIDTLTPGKALRARRAARRRQPQEPDAHCRRRHLARPTRARHR